MQVRKIAVVGAGHAGVQAAASLREEGFEGTIILYGEETDFPYHRPPLSKAYLKGGLDDAGVPLRAAQYFAENRIELRLGGRVGKIDRAAFRLETDGGVSDAYDALILATGAKPRAFDVPGAELPGVHALRNLADARKLRSRLVAGRRLVVVGAGFIGLEIAATARAFGMDVDIAEIATRPMGRAISEITSAFFLDAHKAFGARFHLGRGVREISAGGGGSLSVTLSDGTRLPADSVVAGVGVLANDDLAREAGLACENGVAVNDRLETSDSAISAIGDCAAFPAPGLARPIRLESVQNATDQARCVARRLTGRPEAYGALPWFWSDQGDLKLQIAGLSIGVDGWVMRGDPQSRSFSVFGFRGAELAAVESVNRGADHMAARRILAARTPLSPAQAADPQFDLRRITTAAVA